ncbi:MAG: NADH-quinone oxidoreductase subunit C, partial [Thermodesulfobacteriota bacterium]|nr:NADH-quinone oxidoreductase subunit C [Thermodesulfobacteriota bacterium]
KGFEYLKFITATDFEDGLILTYVISNIKLNEDLEFNIILEDACEVPSLAQIFSGANWQEREIYDLFGINFINHPNMKRIMMPDDWEGYPLRKEYSMNTHKLPYRPTKEEYESWKTKL